MDRAGKESPEFMEATAYTHLGSPSGRVKVGPGTGLDNGVISLGGGRVMVLTVDPISAVPAFGMKLSAWLSVHLIASDYTASGVDPEFAVFAYNFPRSMSSRHREVYLKSVGEECSRLGIAIAGGHTGSYPGGGYTVIGAGAMFGLASEGGYVTPAMSNAGDAIMMTKGAAIEAAGSLALSFPRFLAKKVGHAVAERAAGMIRKCSTVADARTARRVGLGSRGITSMHDATEGGVLGALDEMARASRKAFAIETERIPVSEEAEAVCGAFGINPLRTMGEGALLITCAPGRVAELERAMSDGGIPVVRLGKVGRGRGLLQAHGGSRSRLSTGGPDGYWGAYDRALRQGLR